MSDGKLIDAKVDRITGALGALLSISYLLYARGIEDSLLADAVGASGVPTGVGMVLLLASVALFCKSWAGAASAGAQGQEADGEEGGAKHPHRMALGLLGILAAYVALLPFLGYVVCIGLLVGSVAWLAGARKRLSVLACMVIAGPALWLMFDWALEIHMPVGLWPKLLGK
jgi:putative tricarboxylic transport membrane protein